MLEPQNVEQGMLNVEGFTSNFCGSLFDIRHSLFLSVEVNWKHLRKVHG
jgi:hypothetical protein